MSHYYSEDVRTAHKAAEAAVKQAQAEQAALRLATLEVDDRLTELANGREDVRRLEARHEAKIAAMHAAIEEQASNWPYELSEPQKAENE